MKPIDRIPQADTRSRRNFDKLQDNFNELLDLSFATAFSVMPSGVGQQAIGLANDAIAIGLATMPAIQPIRDNILTEAFLSGSANRGI
jgi:putative Mn2+ efflux pump MntP